MSVGTVIYEVNLTINNEIFQDYVGGGRISHYELSRSNSHLTSQTG